jgi:hypothetical protein
VKTARQVVENSATVAELPTGGVVVQGPPKNVEVSVGDRHTPEQLRDIQPERWTLLRHAVLSIETSEQVADLIFGGIHAGHSEHP